MILYMSIKLELTTLQERLKGLRVAHLLNLEKLAKLIELSKSVSGNYKTNDYKEINHCNLATLAQFYKVSTDLSD